MEKLVVNVDKIIGEERHDGGDRCDQCEKQNDIDFAQALDLKQKRGDGSGITRSENSGINFSRIAGGANKRTLPEGKIVNTAQIAGIKERGWLWNGNGNRSNGNGIGSRSNHRRLDDGSGSRSRERRRIAFRLDPRRGVLSDAKQFVNRAAKRGDQAGKLKKTRIEGFSVKKIIDSVDGISGDF